MVVIHSRFSLDSFSKNASSVSIHATENRARCDNRRFISLRRHNWRIKLSAHHKCTFDIFRCFLFFFFNFNSSPVQYEIKSHYCFSLHVIHSHHFVSRSIVGFPFWPVAANGTSMCLCARINVHIYVSVQLLLQSSTMFGWHMAHIERLYQMLQ